MANTIESVSFGIDQMLIGCLGATFLVLLSYPIYNLWFHPLSKFPGPKAAAVSPLWIMRRWLSGKYVNSIQEVHDQYGPVVRTAPNQLSFSSPASWKDIYGHLPGRKQFVKGSFYEPLPGEVHNIISVSKFGPHATMRKSLSYGFSASALAAQEDRIQHFADLLIRQIEKNCCSVAGDMTKWYNLATFDAIGELSFGDSFGSLESGMPHFWIEILFASIKTTNFMRAFEYIPPLRSLFRYLYSVKLLPSKITAPRAKQWSYSREMIEKRLRSSPTRPDFLTKMIDDREKNQTSIQDLQSQANILVVAGSETTATALSGITYYLCRTPKAYETLACEIREAFSSSDQINGRSTEALPYLKAVIEEGLRIYPPIPTGPPRDSPGETVDSYYVPKGTVVFVSSWAATHSHRNFHQPFDFIPERWLDPDCKDEKSASQPFLLGSRGCLGRSLAQLELRLILAKIFWSFDLKLTDDSLDWVADNKVYTFWEKPKLMVQYQKRGDVEKAHRPKN